MKTKDNGVYKKVEYKTWARMIARCENKKHPKYPIYGGRGITVCVRWRNNFMAFYEDMGERPENKSIDRINVNGNYEPGNCRWANPKEQANNTRRNNYIIYDGERKTISEWADCLGIKYTTLVSRIKRGVKIQDALSKTKILRKNNSSGFNGVYYSKSHKKWRASITVNKKKIHLGLFRDKSDAVLAREKANIEHCYRESLVNEGVLVMGKSEPFDRWCDGLED